jgi:hypothetical protein
MASDNRSAAPSISIPAGNSEALAALHTVYLESDLSTADAAKVATAEILGLWEWACKRSLEQAFRIWDAGEGPALADHAVAITGDGGVHIGVSMRLVCSAGHLPFLAAVLDNDGCVRLAVGPLRFSALLRSEAPIRSARLHLALTHLPLGFSLLPSADIAAMLNGVPGWSDVTTTPDFTSRSKCKVGGKLSICATLAGGTPHRGRIAFTGPGGGQGRYAVARPCLPPSAACQAHMRAAIRSAAHAAAVAVGTPAAGSSTAEA